MRPGFGSTDLVALQKRLGVCIPTAIRKEPRFSPVSPAE